MASTYGDRTAEFRHVTERLKKVVGGGSGVIATADHSRNRQHGDDEKTNLLQSTTTTTTSYKSEFHKKASHIGLGIYETSQKINRLSNLAKRSSMFDDPVKEIQELTLLIKDDITALNIAVSDLQRVQSLEMAQGNLSEDRVVHSNTVCEDLKNKLMSATKQFHNVLTTRTENVKAHENRKQMFSTNLSRENLFRNQTKAFKKPPPLSNTAHASGSGQSQQQVQTGGVQVGNQLRRRTGTDNASSEHLEASILQQVVPQHEQHSQSQAAALQNVESTITELSGIFTHLATMVAHQGELAIRIDDNMDETLAHVEGARSALLKYLTQISSNRWLMIKIFAILIFFLNIFLFFVA